MPQLTGGWTPQDGAVVSVLIGVGKGERTRLRKANSPIPQPKAIIALIDTGAEVSCIDPSVVPGLGLASKGFTLANLPAGGGLSATVEHSATVRIPHPSGDPRDDF
ncbi:MAG TPA: hypothetical protein VD866_27690, partial [Urbifossiella sp.]|nr:hypothetical protein [Urbifossiella sp.]